MTNESLQGAARYAARALQPIFGTLLLSQGDKMWARLHSMTEEQRQAAVLCIHRAEPMPAEYGAMMMYDPLVAQTALTTGDAKESWDIIVRDARAKLNASFMEDYVANLALVRAAAKDANGELGDPFLESEALMSEIQWAMQAQHNAGNVSDPYGFVAASGFTPEASRLTPEPFDSGSLTPPDKLADWEQELLGNLSEPDVTDVPVTETRGAAENLNVRNFQPGEHVQFQGNDGLSDDEVRAAGYEAAQESAGIPHVGSQEWLSRENDANAATAARRAAAARDAEDYSTTKPGGFTGKPFTKIVRDQVRDFYSGATSKQPSDNVIAEAIRQAVQDALGLDRDQVKVTKVSTPVVEDDSQPSGLAKLIASLLGETK